MPIVTVELVVESASALEPGLAKAIADAVGRVFDSPAGQTWIRLHPLDRAHYAENGSPLELKELPVFVSVVKRQVPAGAELQAEVKLLTQAIARAVGRPVANVHVEYAPAALHRLAFGGKLVQ
jgi:phenylpyruvate tautomerase PptA (4-oxalocrotonate tautomerase family)